MRKKNEYFNCAKLLSSLYHTTLSNDDIENMIFKIFDDKLPFEFDNNRSFRSSLNDFLLRYYPNEVSIKSNFVNKVLLKPKNYVSLFEFNVGKSRLDLCQIGSVSIAYEIKTELDTTRRLTQQMKDYFEVFEKVYLICSIQNLNTMLSHIPENCGVYVYYTTQTGRYIFKKYRLAKISNSISSDAQLSTLTKNDLNSFFDCPYFEKKNDMINYIMTSKTQKDISKIFKYCLQSKFKYNWNFIKENNTDILEIDYQWFFKTMLPPIIVYR